MKVNPLRFIYIVKPDKNTYFFEKLLQYEKIISDSNIYISI